MNVLPDQIGHSWLRRRVISPLVQLLRRGASPQQLAWSLAAGIILGINPVLGSSTVLTVAVTQVFRLNHSASQIGTHTAYPLQIALFLPFLQAGTLLFRSQPIPFTAGRLLALAREHPLAMLRLLWTWEWHALVVWAAVSLVLAPVLALLFTRLLEGLLRRRKARLRVGETVVGSLTQ